MAKPIPPIAEHQLRVVVCAAANACGGDREAMLLALGGAIVVTANASPDPDAAVEAVIDSLREAQDTIIGGIIDIEPGVETVAEAGGCLPRPGSEQPS